MTITPAQIQTCILTQVAQRGPDKTICPSEIARALGGDDWRGLMAPVREQGRQLAAAGKIWVMQKGQRVDAERAKGAIRYRVGGG
ncbi:MAG: DUF3253 domain-containing protein [Cyanobacteria bacterium P01_G01_bin.38]